MTKDEALKLALEALNNQFDSNTWRIAHAIQIIEEALAQPEQCVCGEPLRLNTVHRKDSPCLDYIEREWVGLNTEEALSCISSSWTATWNGIELLLKEKNHK